MKIKEYLLAIVGMLLCMIIAAVILSSCSRQTILHKNPCLEKMIGEMIILGFRGTEVDRNSQIVKDINSYHIGGIILFDYDMPSKSFPRNIESPKQTKKLVEDLKDLTRSDLFIAIDVEGGKVNRLKPRYGFIDVVSAQAMGEEEPDNTFLIASPIGLELDYLGINVNFAPVVDVNINQDNPVIGAIGRSFSKDPLLVYEHASNFIDAMHEFNIITAIKHFPGHGSSREDSHLGLVDITETYDKEAELKPYRKLIEDKKTDMVMTAHVINRDIDPDYPATLSSLFLKDLLKDELNFKGVIVSDDMQMGAIVDHYGFEEAMIKAVNAGCDLLIFSNNGREYDEDISKKVTETLKKAVREDEIKEETIKSSYAKIRELKERFSLGGK